MKTLAFTDENWEIHAKEEARTEYLGQESLLMKEGHAFAKDVEFLDGIIEYDVAFGPARGFIGVIFRVEDEQNYEEFYMRPHQSRNPDATQYTPIYNSLAGWQLHPGEGFTAEATHPFNEWIHVKLVVAGSQAEVYIGESTEPTLYMHNLKRDVVSGGVGLKCGPFTTAHFANVQVTPMDEAPTLQSEARPVAEAAVGTVPEWNVSNAVVEQMLEGTVQLTDAIKDELTWEILVADDTGVVNLARVNAWNPKQNTAFAQCRILSESAQMKRLQFGFSDRVKLYLNDQLVFAGNDTAYSRDYRFLGSMGYYDELYLTLQEGANELWFAVSEGPIPGGWGLQARFTDMDGISFGS